MERTSQFWLLPLVCTGSSHVHMACQRIQSSDRTQLMPLLACFTFWFGQDGPHIESVGSKGRSIV